MARMRIQKAISQAGLASRRAAEELILEGRVTVNGEPVKALPCFVDLDEDDVRVDGRSCRRGVARQRIYLLLNKPKGVVCTQKDPQGRPRAVDMVGGVGHGVHPAGRLDVDATGLIVLTNDGELTQRLTHPSFGVRKTYVVEVDGRLEESEIEKLKSGIYLDGRRTGRASVKVLHHGLPRSTLEIVVADVHQREIQRVLLALGHKVRKLRRTAIGPVTDHGLRLGGFRELHPVEVKKLLAAIPPARRGEKKR